MPVLTAAAEHVVLVIRVERRRVVAVQRREAALPLPRNERVRARRLVGELRLDALEASVRVVFVFLFGWLFV